MAALNQRDLVPSTAKTQLRLVPGGSNTRLDWVDGCKAIGILLVVAGHAAGLMHSPAHQIIYWFHMPLFFFLSGYLLKPQAEFRQFARSRARTLLLSYWVYLSFLEVPRYVLLWKQKLAWEEVALDFLIGGSRLKGATAIFWFPPILFLALCGVVLVSNRWSWKSAVIISAVMFLAVHPVQPWLQKHPLPFDVGVLPAAMFYVAVGMAIRQVRWYPGLILAALTSGFAVAVCLAVTGLLVHINDWKYCVFGSPGLDVLLAAAGIGAVIVTASQARGWVLFGLKAVGQSTFIIMYLHSVILYVAAGLSSSLTVQVALGVCVPMALYMLFRRSNHWLIVLLTGR